MLLTDTLTIKRDAIKHFGGLGAIILQELFNQYGEIIELDVDDWRETCLDYIPVVTIKRVITTLRNEGKIEFTETHLVIPNIPQKRKRTAKQNEPAADKKSNPVWEMAELICKLVGQSEKFYTPNKYLKFAKQLIDDGRTIEYMEKKYGLGGWWYETQYKGQQGSPPNTQDIRTTLDKLPVGQITKGKSDFWN